MLKIYGKMSQKATEQAAEIIVSGIKFFLCCASIAILLFACSPK